MKTIDILYKNSITFKNEIDTFNFGAGEGAVARIHIAGASQEDALLVAKEVKKILPNSAVMGLSVNAIIYKGEILERGILVSINQFSNTEIISRAISTEKLNYLEVYGQIVNDMDEDHTYCAFMFFGGERSNPAKIVEYLRKNFSEATLMGGRAGFTDENNSVHSFVFDHERVFEKGLIYTLIKKDYVLAYGSTVIGHAPLSEKFTITKVDESTATIDEINNKDAMELIVSEVNNLGLQEDVEIEDSLISDLLLRFPILLEDQDEVSRYLRFNPSGEKIELYDVSIKEGQKIRFGFSSTSKIEKEWQEVCDDLQTTSAECVFCYASLFRLTNTRDLVNWELEIFNKTNISGAICLGTIGLRSGKSHYLNGAFSIFTFAEKENYLDINLQPFDSIETVKKSLEQFNSAHFGEFSSEDKGGITPTMLIEAIKNRGVKEESFEEESHIAQKSMSDFLKQQSIERRSKICLISFRNYVEKNAIESGYNRELYKNIFSRALEYILKKFKNIEFDIYNYDESSFFIAVSNETRDSEFIELSQKLYSHCKGDDSSSSLSEKCDFAVTISGEKVYDLSEKISELDKKNIKGKYIVSDAGSKDVDVLQKEFEVVVSINEVIKNKTVVPYFQGIYDNKNGNFFAYEALMRLQLSEGNILFPGDFMEISKKHNLYLALSYIMVSNVLDIFRDRGEVITLNISALDIFEDGFLDMVEEKLGKAKHPENFIFELVETEQYSHRREIREFIRRVKKFGSKIAIDDFGSGYSNFIEIGNLEIDYIKINGSLTELLGTDTRYDQILDSIMYLSKKMDVELVAEMVETASMQKSIVTKGIRYSQGYFFSKPMSLEKLKIVSTDNEKIGDYENSNSKGNDSNLFKIEELSKKQSKHIRLGGIITIAVSIVLISIFSVFIQGTTKDLNDEFLLELADSTSQKIKSELDGSESALLIAEEAISKNMNNEVDTNEMIESLRAVSGFDDLYISYDGETLFNYESKKLDIDIANAQVNYTSETNVELLSPMIDKESDNELLSMRVSIIDDDGIAQGELYGVYNIEKFREVLDIQSFGGDAFYHLCEVDGTPIIISGDSNNLFKSGDMYDFIATLDISNGYTVDSIREEMESGNTVLLDYSIEGNNRSCVMIPVPGTNWCIVTIVLDEAVISTASTISFAMTIFTLLLVVVLFFYLFFTFKILNKNQNELKKSLEASYFLASSLQDSVETDTLTRTYSRGTAIEKISQAIENAKEKEQLHAIVVFDVDNFKLVNDKYGHGTGDIYLQEVVRAAKSCLRAGDIIGRLGGDEFIILLNNIAERENVSNILDRILKTVSDIEIKGTSLLETSISGGVALVPDHGEQYENVVGLADQALYKAKQAGKNKYFIWDE